MKFKQTKLAVAVTTATLAMAGALVAPQAAAHTKADRVAQGNDAKVRALEAQMSQMRDMMSQMQSELASAKMASSQPNAKVQELDDWMQSVKSQPVKPETKDNMVFFRGGYGRFDQQRGGTLDPTFVPGVGSASDGLTVGPIAGRDAWYFGAGFDFSLDDNFWGLMDNTEVLAELGVNYIQRSKGKSNGLSAQEVGVVNSLGFNLPPANNQPATINQLGVSASPKIKFLKGSAFRPWLIPVGFELNVISPPSDAITVLTPGMLFGAGADYKLWKDIYVGADIRYHYAPGSVDGVGVSYVGAGGYLGIGF
jgi:hypothetical protein